MKKLLIVNDTVSGGGVEKLMKDLIMHWYKDYEITVFSIIKVNDFHEIYPKEVRYISFGAPKSLKNVKGLRKYDEIYYSYCLKKIKNKINKNNYDVLLAMKEGPITSFARGINADCKLAWVHLDYKNAYWTHSVFKNAQNEIECMREYDNIVCVSQYICDTIKERIGDPGNLLVRYNPINDEEIRKRATWKVEDLDIKGDVVRFVSVGRLHYQKGYDMLLDACKMLSNEGYKYEVIIVGEGEEGQKLLAQKEELALDNVEFIGFRDNPYPYMKSADWFISSSRYEGYSLVSQEAAILEVPMIVTRVSGVSELLGKDDTYGIVAEVSAQGIYEKMKLVLDNCELQEKYKKLITERNKIIDFNSRIDDIKKLFDRGEAENEY